MKNDEQDENSPVEMIEGILKRFRTNEIDGRERVKLREEKGVGWRENKGNLEGEPMNNLKRKHRLKESKGFARVGWILDYRLRLREEKGWAGGKIRQLRIELNDEEARVDLTRNAPDEKS